MPDATAATERQLEIYADLVRKLASSLREVLNLEMPEEHDARVIADGDEYLDKWELKKSRARQSTRDEARKLLFRVDIEVPR